MSTYGTPLYSKRQAGGILTFYDVPAHPTGRIWWVDSNNGSDGAGYGQDPNTPVASLDYAIGLASAGDTIYLLPNHAENLSVATSVDADVQGLRIIGLGNGTMRPTFTTTAAAGSFTVGAADVLVENVLFVANFATGTTTGVTIEAGSHNCTFRNCEFRDTSAANEFLIHISVAAAITDLTIEGCKFITAAGSMTGSIVFAGASTRTRITDSTWLVDTSDSTIDHQTTAAVDFYMARCAVINRDTGAAGYCVELKTASTGCVHDCRFGYNKVDAEISLGDAVFWFENYASNTIAESGLLDPATSHAIP